MNYTYTLIHQAVNAVYIYISVNAINFDPWNNKKKLVENSNLS